MCFSAVQCISSDFPRVKSFAWGSSLPCSKKFFSKRKFDFFLSICTVYFFQQLSVKSSTLENVPNSTNVSSIKCIRGRHVWSTFSISAYPYTNFLSKSYNLVFFQACLQKLCLESTISAGLTHLFVINLIIIRCETLEWISRPLIVIPTEERREWHIPAHKEPCDLERADVERLVENLQSSHSVKISV